MVRASLVRTLRALRRLARARTRATPDEGRSRAAKRMVAEGGRALARATRRAALRCRAGRTRLVRAAEVRRDE